MQLSAGSSDLAVAGEDLIGLLERSGTTLAQVARRLEEEFADRFSDVGVSSPAGRIGWRRRGTGHNAVATNSRMVAPPVPRRGEAPALTYQHRLRCGLAPSQVNPLAIIKRIRRLERCASRGPRPRRSGSQQRPDESSLAAVVALRWRSSALARAASWQQAYEAEFSIQMPHIHTTGTCLS
jgi:hypothetical protein